MKKIHFILLAICILVMPLAVNAEPVPGVTDNEVNIGVTNPFSGPAAIWGATGMGIKAYADYNRKSTQHPSFYRHGSAREGPRA